MKWENKTILIAEDDETNYMLLFEYLEPMNVNIIWAKNGMEVLQMLEQNDPDLILLDMKMPGMDGYKVIQIIRKSNNSIPVIAQTAYVMYGDREKFLEAGCDEYISKPIKEEILFATLDKYLS